MSRAELKRFDIVVDNAARCVAPTRTVHQSDEAWSDIRVRRLAVEHKNIPRRRGKDDFDTLSTTTPRWPFNDHQSMASKEGVPASTALSLFLL